MEIKFAATPIGAENNSILWVKAESGEKIQVGQSISIELTDESFVDREVVSMRARRARQAGGCSKGTNQGKWETVDSIKDGEEAEIVVENLQSNRVQTTSMPSHEERKNMAKIICLTPYKEIHGGKGSIYDHVKAGYRVPDKVIDYLRTMKPFLMSPGIYTHPFREEIRLPGPYFYTDDQYCWDSNTWKYVLKYGLELSQEFIDHVMSEEGTKFLETQGVPETADGEDLTEF